MTKHFQVRRDGAVELPAEVAAAMGWPAGTDLQAETTANGIVVKPATVTSSAAPGFDYEEFRRQVPKHEGPPVSLEDMKRGIDIAMAERWARKEANSR